MRFHEKDLAHLTLVPRSAVQEGADHTVGLFLWAGDDRVVPARLRAAFARGTPVSRLKLLFVDAQNGTRTVERDGWWLDAHHAAVELAAIHMSHLSALSASISVWSLASKWAIELLSRQQVVPSLRSVQTSEGYHARWRVALVRSQDRERLYALASALPGVARCFPLKVDGSKADNKAASLVRSATAAIQDFLDATADGLMRAPTEQELPLQLKQSAAWHHRISIALAGPNPAFELKGLTESHLPDMLDQWASPAVAAGTNGRPLIGYRLHEPNSSREAWVLSFHLFPPSEAGTAREAMGETTAPSLAAVDLTNPGPAARALMAQMREPEETLLDALGRCTKVFPPIARSLTRSNPSTVSLTPAEAWDFITRQGLLLERAGYVVEVPAALSRVGQRRVRGRMRIGVEEAAGSRPGSGLLANMVNYRWEACLGEDTLTEAEFLELVRSKAPLVHHRGQWVAVDPTDVARLQTLIGEGKGHLESAEALRLALAGDVAYPDAPDMRAEVVCEGKAKTELLLLRDAVERGPQELPVPDSIQASLRPYQVRGYAWLRTITDLGYGACLADDMGLGKTLQLLTLFAGLIEVAQSEKRRPVFLVVSPTSVLGNWRRELQRFLPTCGVILHHGSNRAGSVEALHERIEKAALSKDLGPVCVLTSYALSRRDRDLLQQITFEALVLDEAQNIKNPEAAQSQAVRQLSASRRVALTGTPVENRLTELWSIIDFLNPGLLGTQGAFKRLYAHPIERYGDRDAAELLRKMTAPFILRRMKTDPAIAPDLPEKMEITRFCPLTPEQAALYQRAVDAGLDDILQTAHGIERRGKVLAMLTQIKQICNHPAQFLKEKVATPRRSGKLQRLLQLLEEVLERKEAALVFTQYREMGHFLETILSERVGVTVPFLHGSLSRQQRDDLVAQFQSPDGPPIMIVSLRAGGTGLNLTRANHVFHYDRWWNPAVEDQATDRAFRIGQTRDVTVHRLVSQGTLEEQIDRLLDEKRQLAGSVVNAGEAWLGDLDDDVLKSLIALGQDAVLDDGEERA